MDMIIVRLPDHVWAAALAMLSLAAARSSRQRMNARLEEASPSALSGAEKRSVYLGSAVTLLLLGAASLGVWLAGGRTLADLGFRPPQWTTWPVLVFAALIVGLSWDAYRQFGPDRIERARDRMRIDGFPPVNTGELRSYAALAASAGFGEEVAYRGFLIGYLVVVLGSTSLGVALSIGLPAVLFGVAHAYQGRRGIFGAATWAVASGFVVVSTGSLWPLILFHAVWDLFMGFVGVRLMRGQPAV